MIEIMPIETVSLAKIVELALPILTSFVICLVTILATNRQHQKSMHQQNKLHQEALMFEEGKYRNELRYSAERERLHCIPYLLLSPRDQIHKFAGKMECSSDDSRSIPFHILNVGMGMAFSVQLNYIKVKDCPHGFPFPLVACLSDFNDGYDVLDTIEPIDADVIPIGEQASFCLSLFGFDKDANRTQPSNVLQWQFEISFLDIQERKYLQSYSFYTATHSNEILRIDSNIPTLICDNKD